MAGFFLLIFSMNGMRLCQEWRRDPCRDLATIPTLSIPRYYTSTDDYYANVPLWPSAQPGSSAAFFLSPFLRSALLHRGFSKKGAPVSPATFFSYFPLFLFLFFIFTLFFLCRLLLKNRHGKHYEFD
jgi:hypothetical protein